jgi:hypothetical protein
LALFDPERIEPVEQEFDGKKVQRFQYTVKDQNTGQEKYWVINKSYMHSKARVRK